MYLEATKFISQGCPESSLEVNVYSGFYSVGHFYVCFGVLTDTQIILVLKRDEKLSISVCEVLRKPWKHLLPLSKEGSTEVGRDKGYLGTGETGQG